MVDEATWRGATDPRPMLEFLRGRASRRKLRLFACGCCRHLWHLLPEAGSRQAVEAEAAAAVDAARYAAWALNLTGSAEERRRQCDLLRDLVGNPFRPATIQAAWLAWGGGLVAAIARGIDEERRFTELPVLADALEEAGCTDPDLLAHCRSGGEHAHGCWALDLILGRE